MSFCQVVVALLVTWGLRFGWGFAIGFVRQLRQHG